MIPAQKSTAPPAAGLFGHQQADPRIASASVPSETARAFAQLFVSSEGGEDPQSPLPPKPEARLA